MNRILGWCLILAVALFCLPVFAADIPDPTNELAAIVANVKSDAQSGKKTEADFSNDIKQFNALLGRHKGEKTDIMAQTLYMKELLYSQIIGDTNKANVLENQLKRDFSDTELVKEMMEQERVDRIHAQLTYGARLPDFYVKDIAGKPLSLANYKGKVVLVDFWATWCVPCRMTMPDVIAAYQRYHDKGFEIIGVSLDTVQAPMMDYTKENNMPWPEYYDGLKWGNKLAREFGIKEIPMNYLLDGNGKIIGKDLKGVAVMDMVANAVASE